MIFNISGSGIHIQVPEEPDPPEKECIYNTAMIDLRVHGWFCCFKALSSVSPDSTQMAQQIKMSPDHRIHVSKFQPEKKLKD